MSYIRAGSSPEGLYVFGSQHGIEFYTDQAAKKSIAWTIPFRHFREVCRRWHDVFDEDEGVKYGDFSCKTVWVNSKFEEKEDEEVQSNIETSFKQAIKGDTTEEIEQIENKVKLTWKGESMYLWDVTWQYVVEGVMRELK